MSRDNGDLLATREALRTCSDTPCPDLVRRDCLTWLAEVERTIPTVFVTVMIGGEERLPAEFLIDGKIAQVPKEPLAMNPGVHTFAATDEIDGETVNEVLEVAVQPGLRRQGIVLHLDLPTPEPAPGSTTPGVDAPVPDTGRKLRLAGFVTLGLAAGGGIGTLVLGLLGMRAHDEADQQCAPFCDDARVSSVQKQLIAADVLGAVSGALAISAAALITIGYKRRGDAPRKRKGKSPKLGVLVAPGGVGVTGRW